MSDSVRFSIVIPTRQRHETLPYTLETVLGQNFENYEIVVSDNFSSPETKAVVDSFGSTKIRYFRTAKPLAMSDNWEFAVEQAQGEYITVLGDDDGLLPHALSELDRLLRELQVPLLHWKQIEYNWPSHVIESQRNLLIIPTNQHNRQIHSTQVLHYIAQKKCSAFSNLPMIYNSFVHRDLVAQVRSVNGRVFKSLVPDIYSGVAFASRVKSFYSVGRPMAIAGRSGNSIGSAVFANQKTAVIQDFETLNQKSGFQLHPSLPPLLNQATSVVDTFMWARDHFGSHIPVPSRKQIAQWSAEAIVAHCEAEYRQMLSTIQTWTKNDPELSEWFDSMYMNKPFQPPAYLQSYRLGFHPYEELILIDAAYFRVMNVADLARLYEAYHAYSQAELIWRRRDLRTLDGKIPWYYRLWFVKQILFSGSQ
jgi:glycosyltransferase involved in cell wall biosynthesis